MAARPLAIAARAELSWPMAAPRVQFGALAAAVASGEFRWGPPAGERVSALLAGGYNIG